MRKLVTVIGVVLLFHAPIGMAQNLVINPGFEDAPDFTGWTQSGNLWYTYISVTSPHSGQYEATLGPFDTLGYLSQNVATVPGETYEISWWLSVSDDLSENRFLVSFGGALLFDQTNMAPAPWTKHTFTVTATVDTATLQFGFANSPGFFFLDDVDVHKTVVTPASPASVGTFRPTDGAFYLDYNGNGVWDGCGVDRCLSIGLNGDIPLVGDWNGSGTAKVGTFRPSDGAFYLDYNGSGAWEGCGTDRCLSMGLNGDTPLVGKW